MTGLVYTLSGVAEQTPHEDGAAEAKAVPGKAAKFLRIFYPLDWAFILVSSGLINMLALALPLLLLQIYDRIIPQHAEDSLHVLLLAVGGAIIAEAALRFLRQLTLADSAIQCESSAAGLYLDISLAAARPAATHDGNLARILNTLSDWREAYAGPHFAALCDLPFAAIYIVLIAIIAGPLAFIPLGAWALGLALWAGYRRRLVKLVEQQFESDSHCIHFSWTALESWSQTRSLYDPDRIKQSYYDYVQASTRAARKLQARSRKIIDLTGLGVELAIILAVCMGAIMVINGALTTGTLAAVTLLTARGLQPLQQLAALSSRAAQLQAAENRLHAFATVRLPQGRGAAPHHVHGSHGDMAWSGTPDAKAPPLAVELNKVTLYSADQRHVIFNDLSLAIKPGECIAVSGPGGSGKTALLRTIYGVTNVQSGSVRIDRVPVGKFFRAQPPGTAALVSQAGTILENRIIDNLTMFNPEREREAQDLAREIGLHEQISRLPHGYETIMTEAVCAGLPLGFQQRLALARGLLDKPRLLLFDDSAGALDDAGERSLIDILGKVRKKTTVVMVTQRPALLAMADRTLRLAGGKLWGAEA